MKLICKVTGWIIAALALMLPVGVCAKSRNAEQKRVSVIPNPKSLVQLQGELKIDNKNIAVAVSDTSLAMAAHYLAGCLSHYGKPVVVPDNDKADILLLLTAPDSLLSVKGAYRLVVSTDKAVISAADYNGVINGIASLRQLLPPAAKKDAGKKFLSIPCVDIYDAPDYWWRGLHLDSSRHFWTIDEIESYIDLMALYKLSVFHWHLIDDQGWRVQIDRYPELTGRGAWRVFNQMDSACEAASVNDASMRIPRDRMRPGENGDSVYGGFYTKQQLRHIVGYAAARGIQVVPEFDVPGHSTILTVVHPEVSCNGKPNSSICPGKDETIEFCKNVYSELFDIFPSKYVHMGGDEVDKTVWKSCPHCKQRMLEHDIDSPEGLQAWFVRQMELFFRNNNRTLIGWDEIAYDGLGSETAIMWWRGDNRAVVSAATESGKHVTCTPTSCLYFDYPQTDAEIDKILSLNPREGLSPSQQRLINGLQGNVWCEYIPTMERIYTQILPRMLALSESAWNADTEKRITPAEFWLRLPDHLARFDAMGVAYRMPDCLIVKTKNK